MSDIIVKRLINLIPSKHQVFVGRVILTNTLNLNYFFSLLNSNNYSLSLVQNKSNVEVVGTFFGENKTITLGALPKAISSKIIKYQLFLYTNIYLSCYRMRDKKELEMEFEISIDKNIYNSISEQLADDDKNTELEKRAQVMRDVRYYDEDFRDKVITKVTIYQKRMLRYFEIKVPKNMTKMEADNIIENQIAVYDIEKYIFLERLYDNLNFNRSDYGMKKLSQSKFFAIVDKLKWQKDLLTIEERDIVDMLDDNDFTNNDSW